MARSAALGLTVGGIGAIAIISGIQGKSIAEVLRGEIGQAPEPAFGQGAGQIPNVSTASASEIEAGTKGLISPFPKGTPVSWGRSDQGVDGTTPPGTPLRAMGNGTVTIAHDPNGFGSNYPVLHIDGDGSFYYGHAEPVVKNGERVTKGQPIGRTHIAASWGNSTTPGGFEVGRWPPGSFQHAGAEIRNWFQHLQML